MHYGGTYLKLLITYSYWKLNVTTVRRQARMKWAWMTMDAMRCRVPCGVMSLWCADERITDNNAEIQKSTTTEYSFRKRDIDTTGKGKKKEKDKKHKLFPVSAPESPALKWFASEVIPVVHLVYVMLSKHKAITKLQSSKAADRFLSFFFFFVFI